MKKFILPFILLMFIPIYVNAEARYLYDVLKKEAENGGLAREYIGEHHDSFTKEPSHKIYHWYAENDEEGNQILEKNNVIFSGFCWQIIRTTDTGGIKMIYNGIPTEGKCNNNGDYAQIGKSKYNVSYDSPAYVGYMNNIIYHSKSTNYLTETINNNTYSYGSDYIDNGDGTYTIKNPTTVNKSNWGSEYTKVKNNYICKNPTNHTCNKLWYVINTSSYGTSFNYFSIENNYMYGNDFTYKDGKYILSGDLEFAWNILDPDYNSIIKNHHYTCWNSKGTCQNISYIYDFGDPYLYYIQLSGGKNIHEALNEMILDNNVNKNNSTIKNMIDSWYEDNLVKNNDDIEETIFCNDRSIIDYSGWDTNGDISTSLLKFNNHNINNNLICPKETDSFSIKNTKAKLNYSIGLLTSNETNLLNNRNARSSGNAYWLGSPVSFNERGYTSVRYINQNGAIISDANGVRVEQGVRPSISLAANATYTAGDGTKEAPYIFGEIIKKYKVNIEVKNETEDLVVYINDMTQVEYNDKVNFKVTPIKGYKVTNLKIIDEFNNEIEYETSDNKSYTFSMPASDVKIIPSYERVKNSLTIEDNENTKEITIEVNDSKAIVYEDTVKFTITPIDGYEVETIEIKDQENNSIEYRKTAKENEYEFIMPDTNVVITPTYRKIKLTNISNTIKNPNTGIRISIIIIFMLIISTITYITIKRKGNNSFTKD